MPQGRCWLPFKLLAGYCTGVLRQKRQALQGTAAVKLMPE